MIHFLTIRRPHPKETMLVDYCYYYNRLTTKNEEWRHFYRKPDMQFLAAQTRLTKESDPRAFIINLATMVHHPGVIAKSKEAIQWFANAILEDEII